MSKQLKSDVRRVEKSDNQRQNREDEQRHGADEAVESARKHHGSHAKRQEKGDDDFERNNERIYNRDYADNRRRRHGSDDEIADSRSVERNDRDAARRRRRGRDDDHDDDDDDHRQQQTGDKHSSASNSSKRGREIEHRPADSEAGNKNDETEDDKYMKAKRAKVEDTLTTRTGGAYIPPARLRMMQVCKVQCINSSRSIIFIGCCNAVICC